MTNKFNADGTDIERIYYFSNTQIAMFSALHSVDRLSVDNVVNCVSDMIERNCVDITITSINIISDVELQKIIDAWKTTNYYNAYSFKADIIDPLTDSYFTTKLVDYLYYDMDRDINDLILQLETIPVLYGGISHVLTQINIVDEIPVSIIIQDRYSGAFYTVSDDNYDLVWFNDIDTFK
jgi:hypothetical protein